MSTVSSVDLGNVLDYIYNGEAQIFQESIDKFLVVAQRLKLARYVVKVLDIGLI